MAMPEIRVRMYRQGLGDCFLLTVTDGGPGRNILIDCGVLVRTPDAPATMRAVATDIRNETGGHLDAVVATHEHWDHISGFLQAEDVFAEITIDEAWLAWTEKPGDELADQLRSRRQKALHALTGAAWALALVNPDRANRLQGMIGFYGAVGANGRPTTPKAMQWIKDHANR